MRTQQIQLATCARWFVGLVIVGAGMLALMAGGSAIGAIGVAASQHGPNTVGTVLGLAGYSIFCGLLAAWGFWTAHVTRQGRPIGVQIYLGMDLLSAVFGIINLFTDPDPAHVAARIVGLIITALVIWWHYSVLQSLHTYTTDLPSDLPAYVSAAHLR